MNINDIKDPTLRNAKKAELIIKELKERSSKDKQVNIRLTEEQYKELENKMSQYKFSSMSEYLRFVGLNAVISVNLGN